VINKSADFNADQSKSATRIGVANLTRMSFNGVDLVPLWNELLLSVVQGRCNTAAVMDMSAIAQLLGDRDSGLVLQAGALNIERVYRSPCVTSSPGLRVLALAADTDIGGNTPLEFLLEESEMELWTLFVVPGMPLPEPLPAHDIAIVVVPESDATRVTLCEVQRLVGNWPHPVLNPPQRIAALSRDRLHVLLRGVPGLYMPMTARISQGRLAAIAHSSALLRESVEEASFPLVVRPIDSHAGWGLAKLDSPSDIDAYLAQRLQNEFFISSYVDYRGACNLFRKYRIVFVDGRPYACHMAISDEWKIWYLNADMAQSAGKRAEEARFMATFDEEFASRHGAALAEIALRIGLDYFAIDCAETKSGDLLVFEADNTMIVHNMDPPAIFPYKTAQTRKIFGAFATMLYRRAGSAHVHPA
jgi:glutathione synthase/RimK-type ligase-like ATP-grasp enzyme